MFGRIAIRPTLSQTSCITRIGSPKSGFVRLARMASSSTLPSIPLFQHLVEHARDESRIAVVHSSSGKQFSYSQLLRDVVDAKEKLEQQTHHSSLHSERIAFLIENGYDYVVTLLSILGTNAIAVPLSSGFPASELRYILDNSEAKMLIASGKFRKKAEEVVAEGLAQTPTLNIVEERLGNLDASTQIGLASTSKVDSGLMLYTSGTTSRPKGVLLQESVLTAQAQSLIRAWNYSRDDYLLHVLPLHHIHGAVNALYAPLLKGSTIEFMFPFNAKAVWERFAAPFLPDDEDKKLKITFFTAVPTIYNRLLSSHAELPQPVQEASKGAISPENLRLNISGSAALPTPTKEAWTSLSGGNVLLERYGMTEVGMALSCGLDFADRVDGSVGWPLPSVEARLVDTETHAVIEPGEEVDAKGKEREGEIQLRGPTVFQEYWKNPKASSEEFVAAEDGRGSWFKTGDVAVRRRAEGAGKSTQEWAKGPMYFIRGRNSVDIIKTGGEKVSALEIERELLSLPQIAEAAVVALPSEQWGQIVVAIVVLRPEHAQSGRGGKPWGVMDMRRALKDKLVNYKIPQELEVLSDALPRNAMGKINKKSLVKEVFPDRTS